MWWQMRPASAWRAFADRLYGCSHSLKALPDQARDGNGTGFSGRVPDRRNSGDTAAVREDRGWDDPRQLIALPKPIQVTRLVYSWGSGFMTGARSRGRETDLSLRLTTQ